MRTFAIVLALLLTLVLSVAAQPPTRSSMGSFPLPKIVGMRGKALKPHTRHVRVPKLIAFVYDPEEPADHLSDVGRAFIKRTEGFRATPYRDAYGWAVGYGMHEWLGDHVTPRYPSFRVSEYEADMEFDSQISRYEDVVLASVAEALPQPAFDALVSVVYNLGRVNTRILDKLAARKPVTPHDFLSTATVNHRPSYVLEVRRLQEFAVFAGLNTDILIQPEPPYGRLGQARSHARAPARHSRSKRQAVESHYRAGTGTVHASRRRT